MIVAGEFNYNIRRVPFRGILLILVVVRIRYAIYEICEFPMYVGSQKKKKYDATKNGKFFNEKRGFPTVLLKLITSEFIKTFHHCQCVL